MQMKTIAERLAKHERQKDKHLLHGDTGVHNFVFHQDQLVGVIDPDPMVGPVIYDFTYAFCSSPDDLDMETLLVSFALLKNVEMDTSRLVEEVVFQLYTRIGICKKVHPHDLDEYLKAWGYWKQKLREYGNEI
jgi:aminoglycoside phosphotransferase (APT) family kinase protein